MWAYSVVGREDAVLRRRGEAQESSKNNERRSVHCVNASESEQRKNDEEMEYKSWNCVPNSHFCGVFKSICNSMKYQKLYKQRCV